MTTATAPAASAKAEASWPTAEELDALLKLVGEATEALSMFHVQLAVFLETPGRPTPSLEDLGALAHFVSRLKFEASCITADRDTAKKALESGTTAWEFRNAR